MAMPLLSEVAPGDSLQPDGKPEAAPSYMEALLASLREEAEELWFAGGGESLKDAGKPSKEFIEHRESFCTKLCAEALHEMVNRHLAGLAASSPSQGGEGVGGAGEDEIGPADGDKTVQDSGSDGLREESNAVVDESSCARGKVSNSLREVRKKDAPSEDDTRGQAALARAQLIQQRLVSANFRSGKRLHRLAAADEIFLETRSWPAPTRWRLHLDSSTDDNCQEVATGQEVAAENNNAPLYGNLYPHVPPVLQRCVVDDFATPEECRNTCGYCIRGMHCMFRRGGQTSLAVSPQLLERRIDNAAATLICSLVERTRQHIVSTFGLDASADAPESPEPVLFESGALLTRLQAEWTRDMWEISGLDEGEEHPYWNAHVDKANVASYDYAALLYLNSQDEHFKGGDFAFIDEDEDCLVSPRRGRLLTFTAGPENLHQVQRVSDGTRFVLAMWFTLSEKHARKDD